MANTPTPHIGAQVGEIARTVLMAGDPLRAKFMAETYLDNPVQFNNIRSMLGYTGTYKGKRVSVMGHGMGIPSIGIYTYELFNFYDVEKIIRIGTCGSFKAEVKLGSIVIAEGACTDSAYTAGIQLPGPYSAIADFGLLRSAVDYAEKNNLDFEVGNILTSDSFYNEGGKEPLWARLGVLAVEMEAYGLYFNAAISGKKSLAILSVSDNVVTHEELSADQRALGLNNMIKMALEIA